MDAQSLHKHIEGSTKQRIHAKPNDDPEQTPNNEETTESELHGEELDHESNDIVAPVEESENVDSPEEATEEATDKSESESESDESSKDEPEEKDESAPKAEILTMHEEKRPGFNAFSSHHASAPVPRQNNQAPIEEAKPVKDNTNAIILILLIAILIIAVAIFGVVVLGDYKKEHSASQNREATSGAVDTTEATESGYDFSAIVGEWHNIAEDSNSCIVILEDGNVSWYNDCNDEGGDHYTGDAGFISGQDAIDDLGVTKERAARMLGVSEADLDLDNTFAIKIYPEEYTINGNSQKNPSEIKLLVTKPVEHEMNVYDYRFAELLILDDGTIEDE